MKKSLYSRPESFTLSPLVSLLPVMGDVSQLEPLTSSLFARYERVIGLIGEIEKGGGNVPKAYYSEQAMLRQVLDWLSIDPEVKDDGVA